jgi:Cap4 SAVED domain
MPNVMNISGVRLIKKDKYAICHINEFSDELKSLIRTQLSSVCYGVSKASMKRKAYNYKNTLKEFLTRYESKTPDTKVGMIGELLTHILIIQYFPEYNTVSPYFNLEERSIKKGFDVVLYSKDKNELWITEVKSGELHKNKNSNETNKVLLGNAKRDLKKRLNENEITFWENAINGAYSALDNHKDTKDAVVEILGEIEDEVSEDKVVSTDKNVILVGSLFSCLSDLIQEIPIEDFSNSVIGEKIFKDVIVLSIQKKTYVKIVEFLKEEVTT